jgi:hypothetical protein
MDGTMGSTSLPLKVHACEACGCPLSTTQVARGARSCSAACRAAGTRARRRAALLARIDALAGELAALRAEVGRL